MEEDGGEFGMAPSCCSGSQNISHATKLLSVLPAIVLNPGASLPAMETAANLCHF